MSLINQMLKDLEDRNHFDDESMQEALFNSNNNATPQQPAHSSTFSILNHKPVVAAIILILLLIASYFFWPTDKAPVVVAEPEPVIQQEITPKIETAIAETVIEERPTSIFERIEFEPETTVAETIPVEPEIIPEMSVAPFINDIFPKELLGSWNLQKISIVGNNFTENDIVTVCWTGKCTELLPERVNFFDKNRIEATIRTGINADTWRIIITNTEELSSNSKTITVTQGVAEPEVKQEVVKKRLPLTFDEQVELVYQQGRTLYQNDKYPQALAKWREALDMKPEHHKSREAIVSHYLAEGRTNEANGILAIATRRYPQHVPYTLMLARIYVDNGDPDNALIIIQNGIDNVFDDPELYAFMAAIYQNKAEYVKSINNYRKALKLSPENAIWWLGLAISLEKDLSRIDSLKAYRSAVNTGSLSNSLKQYALKKIQLLESIN
jgi:tetratricopeptide (TPR) repeat protein